ncbi:MAG: hypothetical protein HC765_01100 [Brachymonas sp.]|nr:hypothetical protein [Brachymonas sp.]
MSTLLLGMVLCLAATGSRTGGLQLVCLVGLAVTLRTQLPAGTLGWLLRALVLYGVCVLILPSLSAFLGLPQAGLLGRLDQDNAFPAWRYGATHLN